MCSELASVDVYCTSYGTPLHAHAGVWLALVKQAPQYAIGFMVYEQCKRALDL